MPRRRRRGGWSPDESADGSGSPAGGEGDGVPICPLCDRPIPPDARQSLHHLVPVLRGGRRGATALLHQICHNEIHAALTETELARSFSTVEALRAHPRLARFRAWIAAKPPGFHSKTVGNHRRRSKRRG